MRRLDFICFSNPVGYDLPFLFSERKSLKAAEIRKAKLAEQALKRKLEKEKAAEKKDKK